MVFAFAITSSVQMVGVYVVFASLILPALAALNTGSPYVTAWVTGILSVICGIVAAIALDAPSGPVTVVCYTIAAILVVSVKNIKNRAKVQ
jgi:zinc/manganese transport system permease protein